MIDYACCIYEVFELNIDESWCKWSFAFDVKIYMLMMFIVILFFFFLLLLFTIRYEILAFFPFKFWSIMHLYFLFKLIHFDHSSFKNLFSFTQKVLSSHFFSISGPICFAIFVQGKLDCFPTFCLSQYCASICVSFMKSYQSRFQKPI